MEYLTAQEILVMHAQAIDETGGLHGIRDVGLLLSAAERPKARFEGRELYNDIFAKAAAYFDSLAKHHVFADGNKRTAVLAAARFLHLNGYEIIATNKQLEKFVLVAVNSELKIIHIAAWLKKNSKKQKELKLKSN